MAKPKPAPVDGRPTQQLAGAYQRLFAFFNADLFAGRLPEVVLNFDRRAGAAGFFAPKRWGDAAGARAHEISINPTLMTVQKPIEIGQTLVHEMVHLEQQEFGKPSRAGYHNAEWADWMERIGLMPSSTGRPGGNRVGQKMADYPIAGGKFEKAFKTFVSTAGGELFPWQCSPEPTKGPKPPSKNKTKYQCPTCGMNVWGRPGMSIRCNNDRVDFVMLDEDAA